MSEMGTVSVPWNTYWSRITGNEKPALPVDGGATHSDYAYVPDPINQLDLTGEACTGSAAQGFPVIGKGRVTGPCIGKKYAQLEEETMLARGRWVARSGGGESSFIRMLKFRALTAIMTAVGALCAPAVAVCSGVGNAVGSAIYYRNCGDGLVTCKHGRSDLEGLLIAGATGGVRGYFAKLRVGYYVRKLFSWLE